jgi:hypothetical protein
MGRINVQGGSQIKPPLDTTVNQVLEGKSFSINGKDILIGTMVNRGVLGVTPSDSEQTFSAGYYPSITVAARPALTGDAATGNVLAGKTFYNSSYTRQTGAMVDRGALNLTPSDSIQTGAGGYYSGVSVGARPVLSGNAVVGDVLSSKTFYSSTYSKLTGTMASKTAQTFTPGTTNQTIAAGQYLSGVQTISGSANLVVGNIKKGTNIFGLVGTLPYLNMGAVSAIQPTVPIFTTAVTNFSSPMNGNTTYTHRSSWTATMTGNITIRVSWTMPTAAGQFRVQMRDPSGSVLFTEIMEHQGDANYVKAQISVTSGQIFTFWAYWSASGSGWSASFGASAQYYPTIVG